MFSCLPLFPCIYFMLLPKNFHLFCKHMLLVSLLSVRMPGSSFFSLMLSMGFSHDCTLLVILNEIFFFARNRSQTRVELFYLVFYEGNYSNPHAPITPEIIGSDISPSSCCFFSLLLLFLSEVILILLIEIQLCLGMEERPPT